MNQNRFSPWLNALALQPQRHRDAVACGVDAGQKALVGEQPPGELDDTFGGRRLVAATFQYSARPENVVGDEETTRPKVLVGELDRFGVSVFVDVVVDD